MIKKNLVCFYASQCRSLKTYQVGPFYKNLKNKKSETPKPKSTEFGFKNPVSCNVACRSRPQHKTSEQTQERDSV